MYFLRTPRFILKCNHDTSFPYLRLSGKESESEISERLSLFSHVKKLKKVYFYWLCQLENRSYLLNLPQLFLLPGMWQCRAHTLPLGGSWIPITCKQNKTKENKLTKTKLTSCFCFQWKFPNCFLSSVSNNIKIASASFC